MLKYWLWLTIRKLFRTLKNLQFKQPADFIFHIFRKMYPMGSQIWRFFEKIGAATSLNASRSSPYRSLASKGATLESTDGAGQSFVSKLRYLNPLSLFFNSSRELRPRSAKDPDSMMMRYSLLAAGCICVTFLIVKMLKN